jgi:uncharacterized glyoxalase superfamily protein PhnB
MVENRSAPPGPVVPGRYYDDVGAAIEWLCAAFGFTEIYRYGPPDRPQGAFLSTGNGGSVSLGISRAGDCDDAELRQLRPGEPISGGISVRVDDVDEHRDRAEALGAKVLNPPTTYPFGERQYTAMDFAGHRWTFTQTVADIDPTEWGATLPSKS